MWRTTFCIWYFSIHTLLSKVLTVGNLLFNHRTLSKQWTIGHTLYYPWTFGHTLSNHWTVGCAMSNNRTIEYTLLISIGLCEKALKKLTFRMCHFNKKLHGIIFFFLFILTKFLQITFWSYKILTNFIILQFVLYENER